MKGNVYEKGRERLDSHQRRRDNKYICIRITAPAVSNILKVWDALDAINFPEEILVDPRPSALRAYVQKQASPIEPENDNLVLIRNEGYGHLGSELYKTGWQLFSCTAPPNAGLASTIYVFPLMRLVST